MAVSFEDLNFTPISVDLEGIHAQLSFPNGYGVSVLRTPWSYGGAEGFYELVVTYRGEKDLSTPIADQNLGWLNAAQVGEYMRQVEALPPRENSGQRPLIEDEPEEEDPVVPEPTKKGKK